jgi:hypothetical protein
MAIVYAKSNTSVVNAGGVIYRLEAGQAWDSEDPIVKAHPQAFSEIPVRMRTFQGWVETATAAPGEVRNTKRG